jgi:ketosteroid isomerase-like protein
MSAEQNKATVRQFYEEVWNKGNVDFAFEVFAEDNARSRPTSGRPFPTWSGRWIWFSPKAIW